MSIHTPEIGRREPSGNYKVMCTAPDCRFVSYAGAASDEIYYRIFEDHSSQYEPDRAPDIEVDWNVSADCSVCDDGGDIEMNDSESLRCTECGSLWTVGGEYGERRTA